MHFYRSNSKVFFFLLLFFGVTNLGFGQKMTIEATIFDSETSEPIAYATIFNQNKKNGTISNLKGFFRLDRVSKNDTIQISFIGYQKLNLIAGRDFSTTEIFLTPKSETIDEVVVIGDNSFLYEMVSKCRRSATYKRRKAKTYFELETHIKNKQVELVECYYNGEFEGYDLNDLDLKNGRIALAHHGNRFFISTETSNALNMHTLFNYNEFFPRSPFNFNKRKLKKWYTLKLAKKYKDEQSNIIYVVNFFPKDDNKNAFEGKVWIDSLEKSIVKVNLKVKDAAIHPFSPIFSVDTLAQVDIEISKTFKKLNNKNFVNSIDFNYQLKYQPRNDQPYIISTTAVLFAYDYDEKFELPFFDFMEGVHGDYRLINAVPYNEFFWENIDEFKLNDRKNKNDFFVKENSNITNKTFYRSNKFFKSGAFEFPYLSWSNTRIKFKESSRDSITQKDIDGVVPSNKYNLKAQIYLDINELGDSLHFITQTIFDPFVSYYRMPITNLSLAFINIYFDLIEIQRRELEKEIRSNAKSIEQIKDIYNAKMLEIESLSEDYFYEVERGTNWDQLLKWNNFVIERLGIDNATLFQIHPETETK